MCNYTFTYYVLYILYAFNSKHYVLMRFYIIADNNGRLFKADQYLRLISLLLWFETI